MQLVAIEVLVGNKVVDKKFARVVGGESLSGFLFVDEVNGLVDWARL